MKIGTLDILVFISYLIGLILLSFFVSQEKDGKDKNAEDYFLAGKSLPWWAIGSSLIAANISAEQIIGMSGSGYAIGMAIASYEWMSALTLIIVGKYFLPIFLSKKIYTMPQFLENRYDHRVRTVMSIFWLLLYVIVNLTTVLYLGALAIHSVTEVSMLNAMIFLGAFSFTYSIYGGMKAVAFTDVLQVVILVFGGLMVSFLALDKISNHTGVLNGFQTLVRLAPEKFDMILDPSNPNYKNLPGISVILGGMWIMNFSYWGFNQYITQRALAAKTLDDAQKGIALAAYLKILMPIIVVLPGIAAFVLIPDLKPSDRAFPEMMKLVPTGFLGLVFAALVAAVSSSLSSMSNSISTLFTLDIYKQILNKNASEKNLVLTGRITASVSMLFAVLVAEPFIGKSDQAYQVIQEFTGFFTPGIVLIFLFGFFWKRATSLSALVSAIGSFVLSIFFKISLPEIPFMDRVGIVFILCFLLSVAITLMGKKEDHPNAIDLKGISFHTSLGYNISGIGILCTLIILYSIWW
jgi:SSS family solute:Na+ symporter